MDYNDTIVQNLNKLFLTYLNIDFNKNQDLLTQNLLSEEINIAPRDLVCLFFRIEEEFHITIPENDILNGKFTNFYSICKIIEEQLF